jgi:hypothetical protein
MGGDGRRWVWDVVGGRRRCVEAVGHRTRQKIKSLDKKSETGRAGLPDRLDGVNWGGVGILTVAVDGWYVVGCVMGCNVDGAGKGMVSGGEVMGCVTYVVTWLRGRVMQAMW